ncbi:MAG: glycosyltransferase, partial [Desulfuromusa sp.]|nr:glycosyltransferase [Desulfuromusa sp.]
KDAFVLLTFGRLREYKGIESLIDQLILLEHNVTLVVAGKGSVSQTIQKQARGTNVTLKLYGDFIPDDDVPTFFAVADVMVAPYVQILTSGAIILGLSMGVPIIAPAIGCLPELVDDNVGILYDPTDPLGLLLALRESLNLDLSLMSRSAEKKAAELEWTEIGKETAIFYRKIVNHE